jgi:hypothetical protein
MKYRLVFFSGMRAPALVSRRLTGKRVLFIVGKKVLRLVLRALGRLQAFSAYTVDLFPGDSYGSGTQSDAPDSTIANPAVDREPADVVFGGALHDRHHRCHFLMLLC